MLKKAVTGLLCVTILAAPAFAETGKKNGHWQQPGKPGHHQEAKGPEGHGKWVPPGLDKKPGNMPPGQYKKIHGDRVDYRQYLLPPPPNGQIYVRDGDQLYRVMRDTMIVAAALGVISQYIK